MSNRKRVSFAVGLACTVLGGAATAAGCGGAPAAAPSHEVTVGVSTTKLGRILVDSQGRTLYLFKADAGPTSTCFGGCATAWPPLRAAGTPSVGDGADASLVATVARSDGGPEVTYSGHPLYRYVGDMAPGDVNGQGLTDFGGQWRVVSPAGFEVATRPSSSGSTGD